MVFYDTFSEKKILLMIFFLLIDTFGPVILPQYFKEKMVIIL